MIRILVCDSTPPKISSNNQPPQFHQCLRAEQFVNSFSYVGVREIQTKILGLVVKPSFFDGSKNSGKSSLRYRKYLMFSFWAFEKKPSPLKRCWKSPPGLFSQSIQTISPHGFFSSWSVPTNLDIIQKRASPLCRGVGEDLVANVGRRQVKTLSQGAPLGPDGAMVDCGASVHPPSLKILDDEKPRKPPLKKTTVERMVEASRKRKVLKVMGWWTLGG